MRLPTPPEIAEAPELAALACADRALVLMGRALVAANPELVEQDLPPASAASALLHLAGDLIHRAAALQRSMERYAAELNRACVTDSDDIAF